MLFSIGYINLIKGDRKMRRKLLGLLTVVTIVSLALTGCGKKGTEDKKPDQDGVEKVKVETMAKEKVFVSADWLKSVLDGDQEESKDFKVLEVSWGTEKDSPDYLEGHIPGAIHVDTGSIEDEPVWNVRSPEEVEESLLNLGITKDTTVILYGKDPSGAARVAHTYLWAGVENVKLLNGNIDTWKNAGFEVEKKSNLGERVADFGVEVPAHPEYILSLEDTVDKLENDDNFRLVSVRSYDEYIGETSGYTYIDKAGEPKGAHWGKGGSSAYTNEDYVHEDGTYIDLGELEDLWKDFDFDFKNELAFYCGTGWRATIPFLIMYENGYDSMTVYDGGWLEWQMHDELPVQLGDPSKGEVVYTSVGELSNDKAAK